MIARHTAGSLADVMAVKAEDLLQQHASCRGHLGRQGEHAGQLGLQLADARLIAPGAAVSGRSGLAFNRTRARGFLPGFM
jgi:hypothetical protein